MKIKTKKIVKTIYPVEIVKRRFRGRQCYEFIDKYGKLYRIVVPILIQKKG
jgi:hypothetical protein